MCLENVYGEKKVASEDIVVYKVVAQKLSSFSTDKACFHAPFRDYYTYTMGAVMTSNITKVKEKVTTGYHSFVRYEDAKELVLRMQANDTKQLVLLLQANHNLKKYYVMKAYIPKGSEYYLGTFLGAASCASNKLMILRPLKWWETIKIRWNERLRIGQSLKDSP